MLIKYNLLKYKIYKKSCVIKSQIKYNKDS